MKIISEISEAGAGARPLVPGDRIAALDIMRGLAVLGILLANITGFAHPGLAYYWPPALPDGAEASDGLVWLAQFVVVDGKMRGLFTILFGAGMLLFIERAGDAGGMLQLRRLGWLALLGIMHFYLLYPGDVLWSYAAAGVICLLTMHLPARLLLMAGVAGSLLGTLLVASDFIPAALAEMQALEGGKIPEQWPDLQQSWAARLAELPAERAAMTGPSFLALLHYRWQEESWRLGITLFYNFFETIPLALIGMGLLRAGLFTDPVVRRRWRGVALAGAGLGLTLNLLAGLLVLEAGFPPYQTQAAFFALLPLFNLPMLLGAAVLLTSWANTARSSWLGKQLQFAGRMALSNYVGTSLVMAFVFQGWAGGLYGSLHRTELLVVVAIGWGIMLISSRLWLEQYRQGPLEYLWRCLTYGRLFRNRV